MGRADTHTPDAPLAIGDRLLDRYRVAQRLEVGGHSVVYRGDDERLSRPVCIKVFHRLRDAEGTIYRTTYDHFVQEAFALSKLTHPNTLRIYDFGYMDEEGPPFQISEFMNGGTLFARVRNEGPMVHEDAYKVIVALCGALAEAHELGIIHRDIKPKNILFGTAGPNRIPKLADFGIAKSVPAEAGGLHNRAEDTQVVAGRPLLMYSRRWAAPEQMAAQPVSPRTDIYSLALIIAFMLSGKYVFSSNDPVEAYRQRTKSDTLLHEALADADVPSEAVAVLRRALSFDAAERPADIAMLAKSLAEVLGPAPTPRPQKASAPVLATVPAREEKSQPPSGPPRRLQVGPVPQAIGDRNGHFVPAPFGIVDVTEPTSGARARLTLIPQGNGFVVNVKGLNCFVAREGGRPTRAVSLRRGGGFDMVAPNRKHLAHATMLFGKPAAGHRVFEVGDHAVAVGVSECPEIVALDFGDGADCLFVYIPRPAQSVASNAAPHKGNPT